MADEQDIPAPQVQDEPQVPVDTPTPQRKMYDLLIKGQLYSKSFDDFQKQYSKPADIDKLYNGLNGAQLYSKSKEDFYKQYFPSGNKADTQQSPTPKQAPSVQPNVDQPAPESQVEQYPVDPIQELRKLNEQANQPMRQNVSSAGEGAPGIATPYPEDVARNKGFQQQYEQGINNLASDWGTDAKTTKQVFSDFGEETRADKLKGYADLAKNNPVYYSRLKDANDIRSTIAKAGPEGVHDANIFNDLQQSDNYDELQHNIAMQQEILTKYGLGQQYFEKLKNTQSPLINTVDPGLNMQYWNSDDHKLGLSIHQYAGLETEKMFNPGKYKEDLAIIRENKGLDEGGNPRTEGQGKKGYEYDRGVENVLFNLERQGRQNDYKFISQRRSELGTYPQDLQKKYQDYINSTTDPLLIKHFQEEYNGNPIIQEARRIDDAQQALEYSNSEDERRFPLNYSDQATRLVKDAMDGTNGVIGDTGKWIGNVVTGAGESGDNTVRFIKNSLVNLWGSQDAKAVQHAKDMGHQSLTELSTYNPKSYTGTESPLLIPDELTKQVQSIFDDNNLSSAEKEQKAFSLVQTNSDLIKINPKAGQQNLTGKSMAFTAANTIGQILGIADQSMLMGGLLGDAAKAKQMASTLIPMYASTQNQLYEQALSRGDEKPLLKSSLDAAIISLASLINPDIKVVKGMVGAETGMGKLIAGVDESTWNKVLSENRPLVDRMIAGTKATARQLGLANLQYGLIVPTAQYLVHKNVLNEDPNLGDMLKDGIIQTNITMAIPALAHGIWGAIKATDVNPMQKYSIMEAGLHPKENIDLIDGQIERGQITPDKGAQVKEVIKQTGEILKNTEFVKTDGTPMNEQEVSDVTYNMLRKRALEGKLRNAPDPQKPLIESQIHEVDKDISDLHTSEEQKHKTELNTLLSDNLERIKRNMPAFEGPIKDAIAENRPEEVMQMIADQATETTNVDGKEVSSRAATEEIFGKELVKKAIELQNNKTKSNGENSKGVEAGQGRQVNQSEGAGSNSETAPSLEHTESYAGVTNVKLKEPPAAPEQAQPAAQPESTQEPDPNALPFGRADNIGIAHEYQIERAHDVGVTATERGEGITLEQSVQRGRDLIAQGVDPQEVFNNFQKDGRISWEDMSVVRARNEQLARAANAAVDQHGENSPEAKEAIKIEREWYANTVKPMQTEWSKIGMAQQGKTDIDTGSVSGLRRAYMDVSGKDFTPEQETKAKDLSDEVQKWNEKEKTLQDKINKLISENKDLKANKNIKDSAKDLADKIRKGKLSRPDSFSAATPASLVWDAAVEIVASTVEAGGTIAQAIADGLVHVKNSDWYKGLTDEEKNNAEAQFTEYHNHVDGPDKALAEKYVNKKGNKFTPEEGKEIWAHIKEKYLDKGMELPDAIKGISTDLGLTAEQIINAMATPQGGKEVTNEMFRIQYNRRKAMNSARNFVGNADKTGLVKAINKVPSFFFNLKTWGHGTVGNITHAGPNIFRPSTWAAYWPNVAKSFQLAYGTTGNYEKAVTILKSSPNFSEWLQAGLAADPNKAYDEYQLMGKPEKKTQVGKTVQWLNETGTRGFAGLNFMRYDMAEMLYNRASDAAKADPDFRSTVAELVNHATGHSEVRVPKAIKVITFAPGLEISRWQRMITDPAHAVKTFANWKSSSPAEQAAAKIVAQGAGEKLAVYGTLLAANAGLLAAMNSKQQLNLTDPAKSDWLRFKFANKTLDVSGNILSPVRLLSTLLKSAKDANMGNKKDLKTKPGDRDANTLTQQARYKLSPMAGTAVDLGTGTDAMGNVLPWSKIKPAPGKHKMTYKEMFSKEALPIPVAAGLEAYWTSMEKNGMNDSHISDIFNGLLLFGTEGFTGAKLQDDYSLDKKHKK